MRARVEAAASTAGALPSTGTRACLCPRALDANLHGVELAVRLPGRLVRDEVVRIEIRKSLSQSGRQIRLIDAGLSASLVSQNAKKAFGLRGLWVGINGMDGYAVAVCGVRNCPRHGRRKSLAHQHKGFASRSLFAEPCGQRLQCRADDLRARNLAVLGSRLLNFSSNVDCARRSRLSPLEVGDCLENHVTIRVTTIALRGSSGFMSAMVSHRGVCVPNPRESGRRSLSALASLNMVPSRSSQALGFRRTAVERPRQAGLAGAMISTSVGLGP